MNDEKANEKQYRNMRWKGNEPVRPIDENHLSTQKQGLQGALISEPSIPSEMLTSDPPLTPPQRAFAERESQKNRKTEKGIMAHFLFRSELCDFYRSNSAYYL